MADGDADWSLWQNPASSLLGGLAVANKASQGFQQDNALKAYAANPDDPAAQQTLLAKFPDLYTKIADATTAQLKAKKAVTDSEQDAAVSATRRRLITLHPEWFGGQPLAPGAQSAAAADPDSADAQGPTPSPASVNVHTPARAPASALGSLGSSTLPTSTPAASALGSLMAPASAPTSNLSSVLSGLNDPSLPTIAQPTSQPAGSASVSLLGTLGQQQPADPNTRAASMLQAGNLSSIYGLNPNPVLPSGMPATADPAAAPAAAPNSSDGGNAIVVNARRRQQGQDPTLADLAMLDPDAASKMVELQTHVASLSKAQQEALTAKTDTWMGLYPQLAALPYAQRQAVIDSNRPLLKSHGLSDQEIDAFDPTDGNLSSERNLALGYKGVLAQQNSDREFGETVRSHSANEASAAQGHAIAIRGQNMTDARQRQELAGVGGGLDPQSLDYAAQLYRTTGQIPAVGSGNRGAATRTAILQRAAQLAGAAGQSGSDDAAQHADYSANVGALRNLQKTRTAVEGFESTAGKNLDQVLRLAPANAVNGAPIFNRWVQSGRRSVAGDPGVAQFDVAVNTAANEYAKVVNTVSGGGVSTDSARHEAMSILNTAQTPGQLNAAIGQMKIDMSNRKASFVEQQTRLHHNIAGDPSPVRVSTLDQARALPPGTQFMTPDGRMKVR